jgi:hypothetical protein
MIEPPITDIITGMAYKSIDGGWQAYTSTLFKA